MALFGKNENEAAYTGGKKHWADVIKNTGPGELMIWRQPEEDFNTNSTLIVMPGEEAIFIKGGTVEQVFENGTYQLSTDNYPFISRLRNAFTGGVSTFNCVVYFVRKADSMEILWGTDSPIQVRDKYWGVRTDARARGAYKVRIANPTKFLEKLVGNNIPYQTQDDLNKYFRHELQGKVKSAVSKFLNSLTQELIGIDAYLDELSEQVEPYINEALEYYGLKCVKFTLSGLDVDVTKYDILDESQIGLIAKDRFEKGKELEFRTSKAGVDMLGNDWGRVQGVEILKDLANNPNSGGVAAAGAGMGMGIGAAGAFGSIAQQVFAPVNNEFAVQPNTSPQSGPSGRFTQQSAVTNQSQPTVEDPVEVLGKLKKLLDAGLIEQAEYDAKKEEILSRM